MTKDLLPAIILGCYFVLIVLLKVLSRKKQCKLIFLGCLHLLRKIIIHLPCSLTN